MKKILLMCMGGFSTGLLVEKMKEAARNSNEEVEITAIGSTSLDEVVKDYDILLLAPQINYIAAEVEKKYPDLPVYLIQPTDYGRLKGDKILAKSLEMIR